MEGVFMIRPIILLFAAVAPLALAQEAGKPAAAQPSTAQMARRNLDAAAPVPVALNSRLAFPFRSFQEFPLCGSFPDGPSLIKDGDTWKIRMRPGDAPLGAAGK
jgi:hypothetical protein